MTFPSTTRPVEKILRLADAELESRLVKVVAKERNLSPEEARKVVDTEIQHRLTEGAEKQWQQFLAFRV